MKSDLHTVLSGIEKSLGIIYTELNLSEMDMEERFLVVQDCKLIEKQVWVLRDKVLFG